MNFALAEKHMRVKRKKGFGLNRLVSIKHDVELVYTGMGFGYREYNNGVPPKDKHGQINGYRMFVGSLEDFVLDNNFDIQNFNKILARRKG